MKRKGLRRHFALFLACIFALSCLFPAQVALALKDCGTHEVVSCETHNDEHFVARHVSGATEIAKTNSSDTVRDEELPQEEHDASHQIEKGKIAFSTVTSVSPENIPLSNQAESVVAAVLTTTRLRLSIWPNGPPFVASSFLTFLPSIRLQV
jgi:hypothetical protein